MSFEYFISFHMLQRIALLISLVSSQSTDPKSQTDKVCISGSILSYIYFDNNTNGSVYYNYITNQYLYPWIYDKTNKDYLVSSDPTSNSVSSFCHIPNPTENILNPDDCFNSFNGQWVSFNGQWITETDLRLVNCNDICISNNDNDNLSGTYTWSHFNTITNSSIYHCHHCNDSGEIYLYGYINDLNDRYWIIGEDYTSDISHSWCALPNMGINYIFDINDCVNGWVSDANIILNKCSSVICTDTSVWYGDISTPATAIDAINQGKINSIHSWGIFSNNQYSFISNLTWSSENNPHDQLNQIGWDDSFDFCAPFILDLDDYIHGYRVIHNTFIYGLYFYTFQNKSYDCIGDINISQYIDSGIIIKTDYYLSGFNFDVGWVIDSISFQFTALNHNSCNDTIFISTQITAESTTHSPVINVDIKPTSPTPKSDFEITELETVYSTKYMSEEQDLNFFEHLLNDGILLGIIIGLLCCAVPTVVSISICRCVYYIHKKKIIKQQMESTHKNSNDDNAEVVLVKKNTLTPPGLSNHDSLQSANIDSDDKHILNNAMQEV
eukprot:439547_1